MEIGDTPTTEIIMIFKRDVEVSEPASISCFHAWNLVVRGAVYITRACRFPAPLLGQGPQAGAALGSAAEVTLLLIFTVGLGGNS